MSLITSLLCIAAGYGMAGKWMGVLITMITSSLWLPARKYPQSDLPFICLVGTVCMSVTGILMGLPSLLMICGSAFALAAWDLVFLDEAVGVNSFEEKTRRYENKHVHTLALALGCGLTTVFTGRLFNFQIPFVLMILFVALVTFGFERIWGTFKKRNIH